MIAHVLDCENVDFINPTVVYFNGEVCITQNLNVEETVTRWKAKWIELREGEIILLVSTKLYNILDKFVEFISCSYAELFKNYGVTVTEKKTLVRKISFAEKAQNHFVIGENYIYSFDNKEGPSKCLVEIVGKTNHVAEVRFLYVWDDSSGNGYFSYLRDTNDKNTMYVSYPLLRKPTREELEEVYDYQKGTRRGL